MTSRMNGRRLAAIGLAAVVLAAAPSPSVDQPASRFAAAIDEARAALGDLVSANHTAGVSAAVAMGGRVVWNEGAGMADLEHAAAVTDQTRFGIGSISKAMTMAVAVRLWERGLLDLDAPIERYLPDFPHRGRGITVRRIAAHQSGLSDQFATDHYQTTRHFDTLDAAYQEIRHARLDYEPGSQTVYATGLYTIIGRVLEVVSGRDYETLMREELFAPAGMQGVVPNDRRAIIPHRTGFYQRREGGGFEHGPFFNPSFKLPGAGYLATAGDLARFGVALLDGTALTARGRAEMFRAVPLTSGAATPWALGMQVATDDAGGRLWHLPGGGIGISSWLFIHPDTNVVVALLANVNTAPVGGRAYRRILAAFRATH